MSSPSERLTKILQAFTTSEVRFKPEKGSRNSVRLIAYKVKESAQALTEDALLQAAFKDVIYESWDRQNGTYVVYQTVDELFQTVKQIIRERYEFTSTRCAATKRKTIFFIKDIRLEDKHLANYLLQMFATIKSPEFGTQSDAERQALFEPLEALRRTYGKR